MKIRGTSLIPAATPTPTPFHRLLSGWHRSTAISIISTSSIWPCCSDTSAGSIHSATALSPSTAACRRRPRQPSCPDVTQTVTGTAAKLAAAISHFSSAQGRNEVTANPAAANGV
jgi:hypothetical protein